MTSIDTPPAEAREMSPTTISRLRAMHQFDHGSHGDGYNEPAETWEGCSCGVMYSQWQQHFCPDDCPCREAEPVDVVTAHAEHILAMAIRARLAQSHGAAARVIPADTRPYDTQTQALDALPVHTLVSYRDHDGELHTLEKTYSHRLSAVDAWHETTARFPVTTYNLVRNEVDYTIVRMGDGS